MGRNGTERTPIPLPVRADTSSASLGGRRRGWGPFTYCQSSGAVGHAGVAWRCPAGGAGRGCAFCFGSSLARQPQADMLYGGGALDKETLGKESGVWKPVELQLWIGHGYRRRPHQTRNPPGSEASWARSLTNAPTVFHCRAHWKQC